MTITAIILSAVAVITDLRTDKIPNYLTVSGMLLGAMVRIIFNGSGEILPVVIDVTAAFAVTFLLFLTGALRGGDGKLLCAMSAMLGFSAAGMILLLSLVFAAAGGCIKMIFTKRKFLSKTMIHFSVPTACAVVMYVTGTIIK